MDRMAYSMCGHPFSLFPEGLIPSTGFVTLRHDTSGDSSTQRHPDRITTPGPVSVTSSRSITVRSLTLSLTV